MNKNKNRAVYHVLYVPARSCVILVNQKNVRGLNSICWTCGCKKLNINLCKERTSQESGGRSSRGNGFDWDKWIRNALQDRILSLKQFIRVHLVAYCIGQWNFPCDTFKANVLQPDKCLCLVMMRGGSCWETYCKCAKSSLICMQTNL